jgi:hypothetical protein
MGRAGSAAAPAQWPDEQVRPPLLIMTIRALRLVARILPGPGGVAAATWLVLGDSPPQSVGWEELRCVPTLNCTKLQEIRDSRTALSSYAGRTVALYDLEAWDLTPRRERRSPAQYASRAADLLRDTPVILALAPSLSLASERVPHSASPEEAYFEAGLIEGLAPVCQIFHIQSQRLERVAPRFASFVTEVARRARAINPSLYVTAGLSTNPPGAPVAFEHLRACVELTQSVVDGYWLNVPKPGRRCPRCNPENPSLAAEFLAALRIDDHAFRLQRSSHGLSAKRPA